MATIRFSHNYTKLPPDPDPSNLLEVLTVDRSDLHRAFIEYDTHIVGGGHYNPPTGKLILLLLQSCGGEVFTTIRRHTSDKHKYYLRLRGKPVHIVVEERKESLGAYL